MCAINDLLGKYSKTKKTKRGYRISCVKGLWGVDAPSIKEAQREAIHYFRQYYCDGEYDADGGLSKFIEMRSKLIKLEVSE